MTGPIPDRPLRIVAANGEEIGGRLGVTVTLALNRLPVVTGLRPGERLMCGKQTLFAHPVSAG